MDRARAWAEAALERAGREGVRLEPTRAIVLVDARAGRPVWEIRLAVWEPAGTATVRIGSGAAATGRRTEVVFGDDPALDLADLTTNPLPADDRRLADAATVALAELRARDARPAPADGRVAGKVRWAARSVRGGLVRGELVARVELEKQEPDGVIAVRLDATTGERLGLQCHLLLRGSRRSTPLGRAAAVARARRWLTQLEARDAGERAGERAALPEPGEPRGLTDAPRGVAATPRAGLPQLVRARLSVQPASRTWLMRFRLKESGPAREVVLVVNSRTGAVASLRVVNPWRGVGSRDQAEADLTVLARVRLGPAARVGSLILGDREGQQVWLGVVHVEDGRLYRATVERGRVRFQKIRAGA